MRSRKSFWILLGLLCLAGAWFFWHQNNRRTMQKKNSASRIIQTFHSASSAPKFLTKPTVVSKAVKTGASVTNKFAYRLSNTSKPIGELVSDDKAILLENALIDLRNPLNFSIPKNLQSQGDPGAYIVQANGPIDNAFRAMLAAAGATIVSYIPNDAYLVRASASVANGIAADGFSVIPYEPYYKVQSSLLPFDEKNLPQGTALNLGLFGDDAPATIQQIEKLGGQVFAEDTSPFGKIVRVIPPQNWTALAQLPGVQIVEPFRKRALANDLSRVALGISTNTITAANYMGLTGTNVLVEMNDSGVDARHPDLAGRVIGDVTSSLVDTNGHGTHVAGIILGSGLESDTIDSQTNTLPSGSVLDTVTGNTDFRGKAPLAKLFSIGFLEDQDSNAFNSFQVSDAYLQATPAQTNALISNNSWGYDGDDTYDLAAASYDAAVRDALPGVTGSQPVLFVFAAGNDGAGDNNGGEGNPDTISSPATAKNVITVGATEQLRNITNYVVASDGTSNQVWLPMTDSSSQVASFSSRGNVGIGIEGDSGRFKPDVVAPGTFVVSTRSEQWDTNAYYNPTNFDDSELPDQIVDGASLNFYQFAIPENAVQITFQTVSNIDSPAPFPNLPILVWKGTDPRIANPNPPTGNGSITITGAALTPVGTTWTFAVSNNTSQAVSYDLLAEIVTTNDNGNYFHVLQQLNDSLGASPHYYRYESGTSMAAPAVSGVLALMQDYFTNTLHSLPSPALLKAMVINGARQTANYNFEVGNALNFQGWGLVNLPDALQPGITNKTGVSCSSFILDQSPTNSLATGDSQTFFVSVTNEDAQAQPLRVTLAWTDPPGNPAAAIKLVNDLNLVVTNLDDPANPIVYYGNDITDDIYNNPEFPNSPPVADAINNIENVYIAPLLGTNYSITVIGNRVNVNAVTAQMNNVVQDYALVISSGDGQVTNAMTVTANPIVSNPTSDQQITDVTNVGGPLLNQTVGANTPLLGTNSLLFTNTTPQGFSGNWQDTIGMTNQWHFYVITNVNSANFTNAAFITFEPDTLSIPREGVFESDVSNATRPEADIDLYVTTDSNLLVLNTLTISNCIVGTQIGASAGGKFYGASLSRGGTEYVVDTNSFASTSSGEVYYIGVKSEDQEASEYDFLPVFTTNNFSVLEPNGNEIVNGVNLPINIPDGSPARPGVAYVIGLALYPMEVGNVVVTDQIWHQNFGDLIGPLKHNDISAVLNNHDSLGNTIGDPPFVYDDSGANDIVGSRPSDGPGSLNNFRGTDGAGPWILTEVDDSLTQTGSVQQFSLQIQPHQTDDNGHTNTIAANGSFLDFVDVPLGATNLTITVTNLDGTANPPLELFVKYGSPPTTSSFDEMILITNATSIPPQLQGSISIVPPMVGVYYFAVFNPNGNLPQRVIINVNVELGSVPAQVDFSSSGPVPLLDDAVTSNSIAVTADETISSVEVGLRVDHPRVSDLVFHLISPDGTRVLLVENRGGTTTNGMGVTLALTNSIVQPQSSSGGPNASTNVINTGQTSGTMTVQYNFYTLPDEMVVYDQTPPFTRPPIFDSGLISGSGVFNIPYNNAPLTIIMNPNGNSAGSGDLWDYTVDATGPAYEYLVLTEDTNKTTTPIKFAPPPFVPGAGSIAWQDGFEESTGTLTEPTAGQYFSGGWLVDTGSVDVVAAGYGGPPGAQPYSGNYFIDLDGSNPGEISTNIATILGQTYVLNFAYSLNPDFAANGEPFPSAQVLIDGNPLASFSVNITNTTWNNLVWNPTSYVFTATSPVTSLAFQSLDPPSDKYGVLLDAVSVSGKPSDLYYLPEQSLDTYAGENANGEWTLEVQDDRVGATNPAPSLVSWQLRFNFTTPTTPASSIGTLTNAVPLTNGIPPDSIAYYLVNVPTNADFATNSLSMTNGPLSLWFNQTTPPTGTNVSDYLLFSASTNDFTVLSTNSTPTNFVPGGSYYLAVQNTNSFAVSYDIEVNFHLVLPPPTSPITNYPISGIVFTNIGGTPGILLTWFAPTNYQFQIQWTRSLSPPISWTTVPGVTPTLVPGSVVNGIGTYQWFDDFSLTGGFGILKFYRLIAYPPGVPVPPLLIISGVQILPGGNIQLQWLGSTNYLYDVLWSTSLALPTANWNVISNLTIPPLAYTNGVFTFNTNTVTLTGGAASAFFQILELP
jgi:subtilisin-like proprotein convertase family protein